MMHYKFKYFAVAVAFMFFGCAVTAVAQEEVTYDKMFNNVEETEEYDVVTLASMEENLSIFVRLIKQSGVENSIELAGPVTLLAPTNEAFQEMSREEFEELGDPANRAMLERFIKDHILPGKVYLSEFEDDQVLQNSEGVQISVETAGAISTAEAPASVVIGGASIIKPNVEATNGLIHVVDSVIIPE